MHWAWSYFPHPAPARCAAHCSSVTTRAVQQRISDGGSAVDADSGTSPGSAPSAPTIRSWGSTGDIPNARIPATTNT